MSDDDSSSLSEEETLRDRLMNRMKRKRSPDDDGPPMKKVREKTDLEKKDENPEATATPNQPIQHSARRRRMIRQVKHFLRNHPKLDIHAVSQIDKDLAHMGDEDISVILDNIKEQVGTVSPFASTMGGIRIAAMVLEKKMQCPGFANTLCDDADLIAAVDDLLPSRFAEAGGIVQIVTSIFSAYLNPTPRPPPTAPKKKNGSNHSPKPTPSDGEIPDGEDDLHSETDPTTIH